MPSIVAFNSNFLTRISIFFSKWHVYKQPVSLKLCHFCLSNFAAS